MRLADSEPFTFTAALQTHFAVHNLATHARHVRILGLGGKWIFDYTPDPMHPRLDMEKEDYITFGGDNRIGTTLDVTVTVAAISSDCSCSGDVVA